MRFVVTSTPQGKVQLLLTVADGRLQRRRVTIAAVIARGDGDWAILDAARSEVVESDWVVTSPISTETTSTAVREQRQTHKDQPDE